MLTKDLVLYRRRGDTVKPVFIKKNDDKTRHFAAELLRRYQNSIGASRGEIEDIVKVLYTSARNQKLAKGLNKIINDKSVYISENKEDMPDIRKKVFAQSAALIKETEISAFNDYRKKIIEKMPYYENCIKGEIYSDLPENEKLNKIDIIDADDLIRKYNISLVQAILLYSDELNIEINEENQAKIRNLLRYLKFFRLLAEIKSANFAEKNNKIPNKIKLKVSGPLSVLKNKKKYGFQIACFFPALVNMNKWKIEASVKLSKGRFKLKLNEKSELISHYRHFGDYVPEEIKSFYKSFEKKKCRWKISQNSQILNFGGGKLIFPDFEIKNLKNGEIYFIELFHRWHKGQFYKRIKHSKFCSENNLIIGYDRKLISNTMLSDNESWFNNNTFNFSNIPSVNAAMKILSKKT